MGWWVALCAWVGSWTGASNEASWMYGFWSGFGSDLGELTLISGAVAWYVHRTCHVNRCWRLGRHPHQHDGVTYQLCRKHHPRADKLSAAELDSSKTAH